MIATAIVLLQVLSCLGLGALILRLTKVQHSLAVGEQYTWSFAIGFGVVGWLLFFAGIFGALSSVVLLVILAAPLPAIFLLSPRSLAISFSNDFSGASKLIIGAVIVVFAMDAFEVPAPATDADTIAYHFDLPRRFWEAGEVFFVPRALDGAAPLLVQMTYIVPYGFGGETALNLWSMVTGIAASLLVYTTCRRYLTANWSLGILVVFATVPAVVYGAGSGQVEVKLVLFALVAVWAAGEALIRNEAGFVIIAGLAAGFFAGGKYFGLMFVLATALALLCKPGFIRRGCLFSAAAVVAGFQWYWWNWLHTGDPVFPMLYPLLGDGGTGYWSPDNHKVLLDWWATYDRGFPVNIFGFVAYPFVATLRGLAQFESTRTGFGPFVLLILPAAVAGLWVLRREIRIGPMTTGCIATIVTYGLWYFLASSQRVRFLLPLYPVLLIAVSVAAVRFGERARFVRPVAAALIIACLVQSMGQALFVSRYVRFVVTDQDREAFRTQRVGKYAVVQWVNAHLNRDDVVMTPYRDMVFLLRPQVFQAHPIDQALVDVLPKRDNLSRFINQVRAVGVTHAIVDPAADGVYDASYSKLLSAAMAAKCFTLLAAVKAESRPSRTLPAMGKRQDLIQIVKRTDGTCPL